MVDDRRRGQLTLADIVVGGVYEELDENGEPTGFIGACTKVQPGGHGKRHIESYRYLQLQVGTEQEARGLRRVDDSDRIPAAVEARLAEIQEALSGITSRLAELEKVDGRTVAGLKRKVEALEKALAVKET